MGKSKANEILLFGELLKAEDAISAHFVSRSFNTKEELMAHTLSKANTMSEYDTESLLHCKRLIVEDERKKLNTVNEKELKNLIERWSSENLISSISKAFFNKKSKL